MGTTCAPQRKMKVVVAWFLEDCSRSEIRFKQHDYAPTSITVDSGYLKSFKFNAISGEDQ